MIRLELTDDMQILGEEPVLFIKTVIKNTINIWVENSKEGSLVFIHYPFIHISDRF